MEIGQLGKQWVIKDGMVICNTLPHFDYGAFIRFGFQIGKVSTKFYKVYFVPDF